MMDQNLYGENNADYSDEEKYDGQETNRNLLTIAAPKTTPLNLQNLRPPQSNNNNVVDNTDYVETDTEFQNNHYKSTVTIDEAEENLKTNNQNKHDGNGVKTCQILNAGKNISVNADQNIFIKELIANKNSNQIYQLQHQNRSGFKP